MDEGKKKGVRMATATKLADMKYRNQIMPKGSFVPESFITRMDTLDVIDREKQGLSTNIKIQLNDE